MAKPTQDQLSALYALWQMAQRDHGGARVAGRFLLGLYNGGRFPFDLTDLRLLDEVRFHQCLEVLRMDHAPWAEVHVLLGQVCSPDGAPLGYEFEDLAHQLLMKGRCSRAALKDLKARRDRRWRKHEEEMDEKALMEAYSQPGKPVTEGGA